MNRFKNNLRNRCYFSAFSQASVGQREASFSRRLSDKQGKKKKRPVLHRPVYEERSFYVTVSKHPNAIKVPKARSRTNRHAVAVAREMKHEFLCNDLA